MGDVHILYPSFYNDSMGRFRERFPPPWFVEKFDRGYRVVNSQNMKLLTIFHARGERGFASGSALSPTQALALADAIARLGNAAMRS